MIVEGKCTNCKIRPATDLWIGEMGMMAVTHGWGDPWCEVCVLRAQIDYAVEQHAKIPALMNRLNDLIASER